MILKRNIVKKSGVIPYLNPRSWDIAEILLPHQRSCHFQKRFKLNLCSKIRSLFSLADSLYAVLLDLNDFTLADEDPNSRFLYRGFVNRDVWQWYVDINLTNEDRTGTHLLLKLLLNSALQHSSSFDAKIQNLSSRATAKGNQFIYMEYVIKVNKVNTYTNSCSRYLSEAIELSQKIGCAFDNVRWVSSLRHFPPSVC